MTTDKPATVSAADLCDHSGHPWFSPLDFRVVEVLKRVAHMPFVTESQSEGYDGCEPYRYWRRCMGCDGEQEWVIRGFGPEREKKSTPPEWGFPHKPDCSVQLARILLAQYYHRERQLRNPTAYLADNWHVLGEKWRT